MAQSIHTLAPSEHLQQPQKEHALGLTSNTGQHPYTCAACDVITRGKVSPLNRLVNRAPTLKYPRSDHTRATKSGVRHKYCSSDQLQTAIQIRCEQASISGRKIQEANTKILYDTWHQHPTAKPFVQSVIKLIAENKLSDFDLSFLQNWMHKKEKGRFARADEQARNLAILYSNKLGEKMYTTTAPILGLPCAHQARKIRSKEAFNQHYLQGINNWALEKASKREVRPLQNGMNGTRIVRVIELYLDEYLVGEQFSPDVCLWPNEPIQALSWQQIQDHVLEVRKKKGYASEAYSFNLSDTTGKLSDILVGTIPQAKQGMTNGHIFAMMLEVEKHAQAFSLPLIGHCTDSASNALGALVKMSTPATFHMDNAELDPLFLGLPRADFVFCAPFLCPCYPSIAYPCWDHLSRTSIRNLMNANITIVAEILPANSSGIQQYQIATIFDLRKLKCAKSKLQHQTC